MTYEFQRVAQPTGAAVNVPSGERVGVIDIGSNTVRLVVYDMLDRVPAVIFNEKVACGLGRTIASTGRLEAEAVILALSTVGRFIALAAEMGVVRLDMVATAAVREAANGPDFVAAVADIFNRNIQVLSGTDEAHYSAQGILAGIPGADGIGGDLGGGSLEIVDIVKGGQGEAATFPVGVLRLIDVHKNSVKSAAAQISDVLGKSQFLKNGKGRPFYAVGGTWRALAHVSMKSDKYPLAVIHEYEVAADKARDLCREIMGTSESDLGSVKFVPSSRAKLLPMAACVLNGIIERAKPKKIVFSALGLREGIVFAQLPDEIRHQDPLLTTCRGIGTRRGRFPQHGDELMEWVGDLFENEPVIERRLRHAACLLSDIGWRGNPDFRAELVFNEVLYAQFVGVDHPGRAFIAFALFSCYGGSESDAASYPAAKLLTKEEWRHARIMGLALRLGQRLSGGTSGLLKRCKLNRRGKELLLTVAVEDKHLVGDVVERRLQTLGNALQVPARIEIVDSGN
jgi:exopolyphosphatase / guanosine-5'-triphosphate,3'-diphosphate pyrophosphatase